MKTAGFIGLGVMGAPMAANLLRKGYSVTVYNRSAGKADELVQLGAETAASPLETARSAEVIVTMVSNDEAVREVYYGEAGILGGLQPGTAVIDCSTVSPALSRQLARDIEAKFSYFLDAPVTGSKPAAIEGSLLFMVGGDSQVLEENRDILLAMGKQVIHTGPNGSGTTAKLAHNTIVGINAAGLIEGMAIAAKGGIDASAFLRIVQAGGAASKQADLKGRKIIDHDFSVQFSLALMLKDLKLSSVMTDGFGVSTPMLESAKSLFQIGQAAGHGESDLSALARIYEEWIGTTISDRTPPVAAAAESASALSNRRKSERVPLGIPVMVSVYQWLQEGSFSGQSVEGVLNDVSEDGLQIASSFPLENDMFVVIHMPPDAGLPPMTGRIIRIEKKQGLFHYGCLLSALPLYQKLQLQEYIARQVGN
ncbi:NAD(P)-binding domain-containing protein [Cohnella caldifontis]|uniref:NAD(P)-binding domain-containing protein n=1 Tax=Cohnella caldifontis TaxID=3027471 RepID=UPI0030D91884